MAGLALLPTAPPAASKLRANRIGCCWAARPGVLSRGCGPVQRRRSTLVCLAEHQQRSVFKPTLDVVAFGNLCVDAFVPVQTLPPPDVNDRKKLLTDLSRSAPPNTRWEVGGNCNFIIAAARLGMAVGTVGHYGRDTTATFLGDVLKVLANTKAIFTNGYIFDELPAGLVTAAVQHATKAGACSVFDPGPRCATMKDSSDPLRRLALDRMLDLSEVVLMTEDEAEVVTGFRDPVHAASWVLQRPGSRAQWAVVKMGGQGALVATRSDPIGLHHSPAFQVQVADTVGCGDSLAAAVVLGYTRGVDPATTLALSNAVGAATAMCHGAGRNVATAANVQQLLYKHRHMPHVPEAGRLLEASLKQARGRLVACEV